MSSKIYDEIWLESQRHLKGLLARDNPAEPQVPEPNLQVAFRNVAESYLSYIKVAKMLLTCYERMINPQKRQVVRKLLAGALGRVLELKSELVQLECSEFQFLDDILAEVKMTPEEVEIPVPKYFKEEKTEEEVSVSRIVNDTLHKYAMQRSEMAENASKMTVEEAVRLIQTHERTRQALEYSAKMQEVRQQEEEEKRQFGKRRPRPNMTLEDAAIRVQKVVRGFIARKAAAVDREEELRLLGMLPPAPYKNKEDSPTYQANVIKKDRYITQQKYERDYRNALISIKEDLLKREAPKMREKLQDDIRDYFYKYKEENEEFPSFPDEEEGGSQLIFNPPPPPEEPLEDEKADKKGKDKQEEKKGKEDLSGFVLKSSNYVPSLMEGFEEYNKSWLNKSDRDNPFDKHSDEVIRQEKFKEVEHEVRLQVDQLMRQELERLVTALEKDMGKKGKKGGKKKGKGGKKGKGKGKGKKKEKDLTPNMTLEALVDELVRNDILKEYPKVHLSNIAGECHYYGSILRQQKQEPVLPCLGDVRRVINEFCILPLGSPEIHSKGAFIKSILFAGPPGTGKKTFVHAICTETGAALFDLSAENIAGKYPGKPGLNMLMHLMSKVGRLLQPTVILITDAEKTFLKKVPKTDKTDPKRLKKDLPKFQKGIGPDDRILICGTTCVPFDCDLKGLGNCYQKIILLSKPDYGCRKALWSELIARAKGILTPLLDLSTLSKVSDGYTPAQIKAIIQQEEGMIIPEEEFVPTKLQSSLGIIKVITNTHNFALPLGFEDLLDLPDHSDQEDRTDLRNQVVMTPRRITYQEKFPLVVEDFTVILPFHFPIYEEEDEAYKAWFLKMPLGKKRLKMLKEQSEENVEEKDTKGKKK